MLDQVNRYLDNLQAQVSPLHIKTTMYLFLRFWDRTFSQVIINRDQLLKIKALIESHQKNVVLLPTHKSFIDMWLLSFIHQEEGIDLPFVCGDT